MVTLAIIRLWGHQVGAVNWNADRGVATFAHTPAFMQAEPDVAPLKMPPAAGAGLWSAKAAGAAFIKGPPVGECPVLPIGAGYSLSSSYV